jgi:hypothetical protein
MTESDWQPLPTPIWPTAAAWFDAGDFMLLVFMQDGVPTWEVHGGVTTAIWRHRNRRHIRGGQGGCAVHSIRAVANMNGCTMPMVFGSDFARD